MYLQIKHSGTSSFFARDNIANFINWCRKELAIHESLMFETDDLVQRKNEKNFILCLLEVAIITSCKCRVLLILLFLD